MESLASLRSFQCCSVSHSRALPEKAGMIHLRHAGISFVRGLKVRDSLLFPPKSLKGALVSCAMASGTSETGKAKDNSQNAQEDKPVQRGTFPSGFKTLVLDVCDRTDIAEVKVKVGKYEMHVRRNVGNTMAPISVVSPTAPPPPIPTEKVVEPVPPSSAPSPPQRSKKKAPFINLSPEVSAKLAALDSSVSEGYALVPSPTVGTFSPYRRVKGKKLPTMCKKGDAVKEGQVIGYVEQFGVEIPLKSTESGKVLEVLLRDGEPIGYGDPIIAIQA